MSVILYPSVQVYLRLIIIPAFPFLLLIGMPDIGFGRP